jgi:GAF domain-containing protein
LKETGIRAFCAVPVQLVDGGRGAVNVYRNASVAFSSDEVAQIKRLASLVPRLFQTIRDRVSFNLVSAVNECLHGSNRRPARGEILSKIEVQAVLQMICEQASASFQCVETSIFLEDRLEAPGVFELMANTWPRSIPFKKTAYRRSVADGATGWVLKRGRSVKLFDLGNIDAASTRAEYPRLVWKDSLDINSAIRAVLKKGPQEHLAPLSFMAAPMLVGDSVLGVIRCSVAERGPFYFADRELRLLELVAAQIGRYWSNWLARHELQRELISLKALVQSVGELNSYVHKELRKAQPDEHRILREALRVTANVIHGAEITDVRLLNEERNELYFAATYGRHWTADRQRRRFCVDAAETSAGAHVVRTGEAYVVKNVKVDPHYSETFSNTRRLIVAPLTVELEGAEMPEVSGVLDIRSTSNRDFPPYALPIAKLLGRQLALYRFLARVILDLNTAANEQKRLKEQQLRVFQDMDHQFKSPVIQAHARVNSVISILREVGDETLKKLWAIRGLCAKAKRVSMNSGLFAVLASGGPVEVT